MRCCHFMLIVLGLGVVGAGGDQATGQAGDFVGSRYISFDEGLNEVEVIDTGVDYVHATLDDQPSESGALQAVQDSGLTLAGPIFNPVLQDDRSLAMTLPLRGGITGSHLRFTGKNALPQRVTAFGCGPVQWRSMAALFV